MMRKILIRRRIQQSANFHISDMLIAGNFLPTRVLNRSISTRQLEIQKAFIQPLTRNFSDWNRFCTINEILLIHRFWLHIIHQLYWITAGHLLHCATQPSHPSGPWQTAKLKSAWCFLWHIAASSDDQHPLSSWAWMWRFSEIKVRKWVDIIQ